MAAFTSSTHFVLTIGSIGGADGLHAGCTEMMASVRTENPTHHFRFATVFERFRRHVPHARPLFHLPLLSLVLTAFWPFLLEA